MIDLNRSTCVMEEELRRSTLLNGTQKENVRRKAADLVGQRLVWNSVPFRILLEYNRRCNAACIQCDVKRQGTGHLSPALIDRLYETVGWGSMEIQPFAGGEPTLAPVDHFAALARRWNNYVNFTTNGQLFTKEYYESIADITARVHFSLGSHLPKSYERIMPGLDFETVVRNIRDAVKIAECTTAHIAAGLVVMDCILESLEGYVRFVAGLGVKRVIFQKLYPGSTILPHEGLREHRDPDEARHHIRRALETALDLGLFMETNVEEAFGDPRNQSPPKSLFDVLQDNAEIVALFHPGFCISTATTVVVEWDGTVRPCCRGHQVLGNLHESSFEEIWNGDAMKRLRASFFSRDLSSACRQCMAFYCGHA
jgi:radical SAM protein with 4Fe4S-binding SPASM domain